MEVVTVSKTSTYYLKATQTEVTITSGALATVTISPPITYTINRENVLRLSPGQSASLVLNGKNWESSSLVTSVFGRKGNVISQSGDYTASQITNLPSGNIEATTVQDAIDELDTDKQAVSEKDATGGYVGLTLFKINFKNALNTFTSFFTNSNTAARTYTFPDKSGTVATSVTAPIADGTYTVGLKLTGGGNDGTITTEGGIIVSIQEAT